MAIKVKKISRPLPGNPGQAKWYLTQSKSGTVKIDDIGARIEKASSLSAGDINNVLTNLIDELPGFIALGQTIQLGDFGTFRISVSSEGTDTAEELTAHNIKKARLVFLPGTKLKQKLSNLSFEVMA
jgi:predicted histone-like DNA-binding protein